MTPDIAIVTACNDDAVLSRNLMASDLITRQGVSLHVERGAPSASAAYNLRLDATHAEYVIFAHQDVYFPPNWATKLAAAIHAVTAIDPNWALIAPFGMSPDNKHIGDVWSTSQSARIGRPVTTPEPAQSFDELAIILRRASGIRFDEGLPGFHLYGTDIVQTAWASGQGAYVADLPLVHNDAFKPRLGKDFTESYGYIRRKWRANLPLRTPILPIRWHGLDLPFYRLRARRVIDQRRARAGDTDQAPKSYAALCGWENRAHPIRTSKNTEPSDPKRKYHRTVPEGLINQ